MQLKDRYGQLSPGERKKLAEKAGTTPEYLYQLATGFRGKRPSIGLMVALVAADKRLKLADLAAEFSRPNTTRRASPAA